MCKDILTKSAEIATIIGNGLLTILTIVIIYLTIRDRKKEQSLKELKNQTLTLNDSLQQIKDQTLTLHKSFIESIKPELAITEIQHVGLNYNFFYYQNKGGSCYDVRFDFTSFENEFCRAQMADNTAIASHTTNQGSLHRKPTSNADQNEHRLDCFFNDIEGRKYKQILIFRKLVLVTVDDVYFTTPERIES